MVPRLEVQPADSTALERATALLEDLDGAEAAREKLGLTLSGERWWAAVVVEGTRLLLEGGAERWSIHAPAGVDEGEAMSAARRLHGLLGEAAEGWDLDR